MNSLNIGSKIKKLRELYKMSQKELGDFLNYTESYISHVESGTRNISVKDLEKIAKIFGVSYDYFFDKLSLQTHFRADSSTLNNKEIDQDKIIKDFMKFAINKKNNLWKD